MHGAAPRARDAVISPHGALLLLQGSRQHEARGGCSWGARCGRPPVERLRSGAGSVMVLAPLSTKTSTGGARCRAPAAERAAAAGGRRSPLAREGPQVKRDVFVSGRRAAAQRGRYDGGKRDVAGASAREACCCVYVPGRAAAAASHKEEPPERRPPQKRAWFPSADRALLSAADVTMVDRRSPEPTSGGVAIVLSREDAPLLLFGRRGGERKGGRRCSPS